MLVTRIVASMIVPKDVEGRIQQEKICIRKTRSETKRTTKERKLIKKNAIKRPYYAAFLHRVLKKRCFTGVLFRIMEYNQDFNPKTMSKNKDQKRKAQVSAKAKAESFKFQVEYARQQRASFIAKNAPELMAEMEVICRNGLVDAMLALHNIVDAGRMEFGVEPEGEGCSLNGALVPYILGFTSFCPDSADTYVPGIFTGPFPMAVTLVYDNEVRNKVVDWAKAHYDGMTTRFGQPFLKLPNMIVEFKRMIKKTLEV